MSPEQKAVVVNLFKGCIESEEGEEWLAVKTRTEGDKLDRPDRQAGGNSEIKHTGQ